MMNSGWVRRLSCAEQPARVSAREREQARRCAWPVNRYRVRAAVGRRRQAEPLRGGEAVVIRPGGGFFQLDSVSGSSGRRWAVGSATG